MPSVTHQTLVALLLERPEVLTGALAPDGAAVPDGLRIRHASAEFTELAPPSYHADAVLRVEDARGRLRHLIIGEVQLRRDRRKRISWPIYVTAARAEVGLDCPVTLVVVAPSPSVARWCAQPIPLDTQGGSIVPLVLGPEVIPRISDVDVACANPGLAVLSAMAHARGEGAAEIAAAALVACGTLDSRNGSLYADMVKARLDSVTRRAVEELMPGMYDFFGYRLQAPDSRAYWLQGHRKGRKEGRSEGRREGREEGREKGLEQGRKQGRRQGRQEALAQMLALQLEQRFGSLPKYAAKAIEAADIDTLTRMISRVLGAASVRDVISGPARRSRTRDRATGTQPRSAVRATAAGTRPRGAARARATTARTRPRSAVRATAAGTRPRSAARATAAGTRPRSAARATAAGTRHRSAARATAAGTRPRSAARAMAAGTRPRSQAFSTAASHGRAGSR